MDKEFIIHNGIAHTIEKRVSSPSIYVVVQTITHCGIHIKLPHIEATPGDFKICETCRIRVNEYMAARALGV